MAEEEQVERQKDFDLEDEFLKIDDETGLLTPLYNQLQDELKNNPKDLES